jgi:HSP20 family protein
VREHSQGSLLLGWSRPHPDRRWHKRRPNWWHGTEQGFYVQLAVPGWEAKELTLDVNEKILTIKGERAAAEEAGHFHLHEIAGTKFFRIFTLPAFVDHEKAKAVHANGLLTISFPKREEAKARRILIEAA